MMKRPLMMRPETRDQGPGTGAALACESSGLGSFVSGLWFLVFLVAVAATTTAQPTQPTQAAPPDGSRFTLEPASPRIVAQRPNVIPPERGGRVRNDPGWNANEGNGSYVRIEQGGFVNEDTVRTARETASHSTGTPEWKNPKGFERDVFTFARLIFRTQPRADDVYNYQGRLGWWVDYPDADLNFSYRLQQLTSLRTDPDGRVLRLTAPDLGAYPLLFLTHIENMRLSDDHAEILRRYLLNGGALFIVDFWNDQSWAKFSGEMQRILPGRSWTNLNSDHPIFRSVFNMKGDLRRWQVPTMQFWNRGHDWDNPAGPPLQWRDRGPGSQTMYARALFDDKGRLMIIALHNCDLSDGWEREGEHDDYFHTFSEKISYPLGINILFYLMTH